MVAASFVGCVAAPPKSKSDDYPDPSVELQCMRVISQELANYYVPVFFILQMAERNDPQPSRYLVKICTDVFQKYQSELPRNWRGSPIIYLNEVSGAVMGGRDVVAAIFDCLEQTPEGGFTMLMSDGLTNVYAFYKFVLEPDAGGQFQVTDFYEVVFTPDVD